MDYNTIAVLISCYNINSFNATDANVLESLANSCFANVGKHTRNAKTRAVFRKQIEINLRANFVVVACDVKHFDSGLF